MLVENKLEVTQYNINAMLDNYLIVIVYSFILSIIFYILYIKYSKSFYKKFAVGLMFLCFGLIGPYLSIREEIKLTINHIIPMFVFMVISVLVFSLSISYGIAEWNDERLAKAKK